MADNIVIVCPACKQKMKVPAQAAGKKARCAKCKAVFRVEAMAPAKPATPATPSTAAPGKTAVAFEEDDGPALYSLVDASEDDEGAPPPPPPPKPAPPPKLKGVGDEDENPYGITIGEDIPRCPFCAKEMESHEAIICLHCGYNTQSRTHAQTKRVYERTFWDWIKWLSPGIGCVLAIAGLIGFDWWFCFGLSEMWKDWDETLGTASISQGVRLWIVVMTIWVMWQAAKFAFRRLILNPVPPEIEKKK